MHLAVDGQLAGLLAVSDPIKASTPEALATLKAAGLRIVMATGDGLTTARAVGERLGIDEVHGEVKPADKLAFVDQLQKQGRIVAMTGDGINDAPALAKADIGFAMGAAGTHTAMEAADVVVMNDDLRRLPETIRLSKRTHAVLWQNISLALGIKLVFLLLAIFDNASMWMAVFADMGASLLVVFNGLRLLGRQQSK
jgi:Cd2+/Zn2+-exporting ATPase